MSINMWIADSALDPTERVKEAACRLLFGALQSAAQDCGIDSVSHYSGWTNPHEQDKEHDEEGFSHCTLNHKNNLFSLMRSSILLNCRHHQDKDGAISSEATEEECIDLQEATDTIQALVNAVTHPAVLNSFVSLLRTETIGLKRRRTNSDLQKQEGAHSSSDENII
jgi:hypothetical protein